MPCHRLLPLIALGTLLSLLPGCTLIGLGVGAGVDANQARHYRSRPAREVRTLEHGERIRLSTRTSARTEGKFAGTRGPTAHDPESYLLVTRLDGREEAFPFSDIALVGVEKPKRGWCYGLAVGAAVDVAVVILVGVAASQLSYGNWVGESGGF